MKRYLECAYCGPEAEPGFSVVVDDRGNVGRYECKRCGSTKVRRGRVTK